MTQVNVMESVPTAPDLVIPPDAVKQPVHFIASPLDGLSEAPTERPSWGTHPIPPSGPPTAGFEAANPVTVIPSPPENWTPRDGLPQSVIVTLADEDQFTVTELLETLKDDGDHADALFKIAVLLHRNGQPSFARSALTALAQVYEANGQHGQAARIMTMLGAQRTSATQPSVDQAPQSNQPAATDSGAFGEAAFTHVIQPVKTNRVTGAIHREVPSRGADSARALPANQFRPELLGFTMPLPGEAEISVAARAAVRVSTRNLQTGQHQAALDACYEVLAHDPSYYPIHLRIAELCVVLNAKRRARQLAETLVRLARAYDDETSLWMTYRVLLHTSERDLPNLRQLVDLLIDAGQVEQGSLYASHLIRMLDEEGLFDEAAAYSARLCSMLPGDTRAALEHAVLRVKANDPNSAIERWEEAVAAGADEGVAKASLAAIMSLIGEDDHWMMVGTAVLAQRHASDDALAQAYVRTADALPPHSMLVAGRGILLHAAKSAEAQLLLATAAHDVEASSFTRAVAAVVLGADSSRSADTRVSALGAAIEAFSDGSIANHPSWSALTVDAPKVEDLAADLGSLLLDQDDNTNAVTTLRSVHERSPHHDRLSRSLATAYFKTGQLGSALTVLDELAGHYKTTGHLEEMASVLRDMSQLAPNNIKVKMRLIETYLQRGFVAEARTELIQRAELELESGLVHAAVASLVRAADLSWNIGLADETFNLYNRAIDLAPDVVDHRHGLVTLYLQLGRLQEAAEQQRAIVDISLRESRKHEAIAALHQVIGLTPDDLSAYFQLGDLLSSVGEYAQAERVYQRILAIRADDPIAQAKATTMRSLREQRQGG